MVTGGRESGVEPKVRKTTPKRGEPPPPPPRPSSCPDGPQKAFPHAALSRPIQSRSMGAAEVRPLQALLCSALRPWVLCLRTARRHTSDEACCQPLVPDLGLTPRPLEGLWGGVWALRRYSRRRWSGHALRRFKSRGLRSGIRVLEASGVSCTAQRYLAWPGGWSASA